MNKNICENLAKVKHEIEMACRVSGRRASEVTLLAVSKKKPSSALRDAFEAGQIIYGENYVQEALQKQNELSNLPLKWHFIGHLQRNKVNLITGKFEMIESVDSLILAEKISEKSQTQGLRQKVLLEVNIGREESKSGYLEEQLKLDLEKLFSLRGLEIQGLMALPPQGNSVNDVVPFFKKTKELFDEIASKLELENRKHWIHLSMGTSSDFREAIVEGATIVRVGTSIFGERE